MKELFIHGTRVIINNLGIKIYTKDLGKSNKIYEYLKKEGYLRNKNE